MGGRVSRLDAGPAAGDALVVRDVTVRAVVVPLARPLATRVGDFARWPLLLAATCGGYREHQIQQRDV
jgi:hypothetical protein